MNPSAFAPWFVHFDGFSNPQFCANSITDLPNIISPITQFGFMQYNNADLAHDAVGWEERLKVGEDMAWVVWVVVFIKKVSWCLPEILARGFEVNRKVRQGSVIALVCIGRELGLSFACIFTTCVFTKRNLTPQNFSDLFSTARTE